MQPRLTRSRTDVMVAGVCGGLGEYFAVDPVIVRLIFVLVTLTSGLGLPVYLVMWLVMPKGSASVGGQPMGPSSFDASQFGRQVEEIGQQIGREAAQFGRELREAVTVQTRTGANQRTGVAGSQQPPEPSEYNFDPHTGQALRPRGPSTGQTINLGDPMPQQLQQGERPASAQPPIQMSSTQTPYPHRQGRNWRTLGFIMLGIGCLIFLDQLQTWLGLDLNLAFPLVLIAAGFILMRRRA